MSKEKFTKGQWKTDEDSSFSVYELNVYGTNKWCTTLQATGKGKATREELEANTHLIAAAPEMYYVLKELTSLFEVLKEKIQVEGYSESFVSIKDSIELLLARARGENKRRGDI